jgi:hypothetical protein
MTTAPSPEKDSGSVSPSARAKYPRRNRNPPKEIHISPAAGATKRSDNTAMDSNKNDNTTTATKKTTATAVADTPLRKSGVIDDLRRVLLVSGSSWLNGNNKYNKKGAAAAGAAASAAVAAPPPPPSNPPPRPTELLSLLMVGPDEAGKKALMEQFVHNSKSMHKTDSSSSSPQKLKAAPEGWSVEYRKKDWAYHRSGSSKSTAATAASASAESSVQCVRLQLWNATVNSNSKSNTTLPPDASLAWPAALKTHCQHMILVVSMADSKSLAELQTTVRTWKRYLDDATGRKSSTSAGTATTMQLILTVPAASSLQNHAAYYLRVGAAMQRLATELSIMAPSWAVLDAPHNESSSTTNVHEIHTTWMNITEQVLSSKQQQQLQRQGSLAAATATANGKDQRYAIATAAAVSTPANRGSSNNKAGSSLGNSSINSPGTIVLDAQDVITISPDKDEHLTR